MLLIHRRKIVASLATTMIKYFHPHLPYAGRMGIELEHMCLDTLPVPSIPVHSFYNHL